MNRQPFNNNKLSGKNSSPFSHINFPKTDRSQHRLSSQSSLNINHNLSTIITQNNIVNNKNNNNNNNNNNNKNNNNNNNNHHHDSQEINKNNSLICIQNNSIGIKKDKTKSVTGYYYKNIKKNTNKSQIESGYDKFTQLIGKKGSGINLSNNNTNNIYNSNSNNNNSNKHKNTKKRQRCITQFDITTNKLISIQNQAIFPTKTINLTLKNPSHKLSQTIPIFCHSHPSKPAFFQQPSSFLSFCHQCSIQKTKNNHRLIHLSDDILRLKGFFDMKIQQIVKFREILMKMISKEIDKRIENIEKCYHDVKVKVVQNNKNLNYLRMDDNNQGYKGIQFILKSVNFDVINDINMKNNIINTCLFKQNIQKYCLQLNNHINNTKNSTNQQITNRNTITTDSTKIPSSLPYLNNNFTLLSQIQKALNYQPYKTKKSSIIERKTKRQLFSCQKYNQNQNLSNKINENKQNICPNMLNIMNQIQQQSQRISFGKIGFQ